MFTIKRQLAFSRIFEFSFHFSFLLYQLKDFLRTVTNNTTEDLHQYSTMFICNKWETVTDNFKEEVRINTKRKLQKFFPNITDDQLFFMSVKQVRYI